MTLPPKTPPDDDGLLDFDLSTVNLDFSDITSDDDDDVEDDWSPLEEVTDEDIANATRHSGKASIYTPNELLPPELENLDLSAYDVVQIAERGGAEQFLGLFLAATKVAFEKTGTSVYECVLLFPYKRPVNDIDVSQYMGRCRAMLSRLRKMNRKAEFFYLVLLEYEILPDRKHVAISTARMSKPNYDAWHSNQRRISNQRRSGIATLKDML